jgi:hypothetical protein
MKPNTNWSSPKTNIIAALLSLRLALQAGYRARLVRALNQDCAFPIRVKKADKDFRNYDFQIAYVTSKDAINARGDLPGFLKHLSTNYLTRYGTPEAVDQYYSTGKLSADNDKGVGRSHLVKASDYIEYLLETQQRQRAALYQRQYDDNGYDSVSHWFDFYRYKHGSQYAIKKFKRKLWVVDLLETKDI